MDSSENYPGKQHNVVHGDGNITAGVFTGSQVTNQRGSHNIVYGSGAPNPFVERLGNTLADIRSRLEIIQDPGFLTDRDDALDGVTALETDLPSLTANEPDAPKKLRRRVKELIGVLAPVAEIIGGIAGLEQILQHL